MTVFGMKNMPEDHPLNRVYRFGGGVIGAVLLVFGLVGLFGGFSFFDTGDRVAGLSTNTVLSVLSVVALLGDGSLAALPGGVEEYLAGRAAAAAPPEPGRQRAGDSRAETRAARRELARLERRIAALETREVALHEQLAEHATDHLRVAELDAELRAVGADRDAAESAWLELAEAEPPA